MSKWIRRALLAALALAVVLPTPVRAQYFGRNKIQYKDHKWRILSTPHFDIHFYRGSEEFAVRAGLVLEDGYGMLSIKLKEVLPWRVPVILYASHEDFLQTNIDPSIIGEGVQAFAEPRRRRIVLPFTQSFKDFQHAAVHELAHIFTFQLVYNRMLDNVFTRSYLPGMPPWVAEGLAEYLSVGWDADSDMYIRDAVIHDYLPPFYGVGGFYVYKEGQSIFNYIAETYGHEKVLDFLNVLAQHRSAAAALGRTLGLSERDLQKQWSKALRKHYWPLYPDKTEATDLGRRLTNHVKDHGYFNSHPILSPDGEQIAFFSDRSGLMEILVMSALDGKITNKVVTGSKSNRFESLHFLNSSMAWSPRGNRIAFIARSRGHDALFVKELHSGTERMYEIPSDGLAAPAWSPVKNDIVLSGTFAGQTDLVLVHLDTGGVKRLTNDTADQLTPSFFPDGHRVAFVYYPDVTRPVPTNFRGPNLDVLSEIDFLDPHNVRHNASYDIWEYNLDSGKQKALVSTPGDDTDPFVLSDGHTIVFASDVSGINNLHVLDTNTGDTHRFTDVLGGVFSPSIDEEKGRIAFSAFVKGGHDIFVSDDLRGMMGHQYSDEVPGILAHSPRTATRDLAQDAAAEADSSDAQGAVNAIGGRPESPGGKAVATSIPPDSAGASNTSAPVDSLAINIDSYTPKLRFGSTFQSPGDGKRKSKHGGHKTEGVNTSVIDGDSEYRGATVKDYKTKIAPDFIGQGGGLFFATGFGFGISNTIAMSDMLGNHNLAFAFSLFRSIQDSDFLLNYSYLKHRVDFSVGLYQFKSFFDSRLTSTGEGFSSDQLFSERNYGLFGRVSVPFNTFYRMDLDLQAYVSNREFFGDANNNQYFVTPQSRSSVRLLEPSLAFVHDSSFYGPFGPVEGSRWRLSLARAVGFNERDVSRVTAVADYRRYKTLFYRNSIAFRALVAGSSGDDPRVFFLGGPTTLRGYDYQDLQGTKLGLLSFEYRFPLVDALILGWPARWGLTNIGGSLFIDAGSVYDKHSPRLFHNGPDGFRVQDVYSDVGVGANMYFGYLLLNFELAWPIDNRPVAGRRSNKGPQFHFFIGPAF